MKQMTRERELLADDLTALTGGILPEVEFEHLLEYVAGRVLPKPEPGRFLRIWQRIHRGLLR